MMARLGALALSAAALAGCASEEILHGLAEAQANEVLVALEDAGVGASKRREDGPEAGWTVAVSRGDAARAQRALSERSLPRERPPGFAEVFQKGSMIPTPLEEHALYLHAVAGELARSVAAIDGVVDARVHLGLPQPDPLRAGERPRPRAAVLVRCRPAACPAVRALEDGIRALVAGSADGMEPAAVAVVVSEASAAGAPPAPAPRRARLLVAVAAAAGIGATALAVSGLRARRRRETSR